MTTGKDKMPGINVLGLVSYNFLPAKMGGQKCVEVLITFLNKWVNFVCVTTKNNDPATAQGFEVLNILSDSRLRYINIFYFFTLRKIIKQRKITHLQIEHPYYGWLAIMLQRFCRVKLVLHSHNIEGVRFKSIGKWWASILLVYEKWVHQKADYIFYITEEDRQYGIINFKVNPAKCLIVPYGIDSIQPPPEAERKTAKAVLIEKHNIQPNETILFLNGAFDYKPNLDALLFVIEKLNPLLIATPGFNYRILICGKNIPEDIIARSLPNITIAGFVDDITVYFKGADIFLNPIKGGGGIKTKLVEALGYDLFVVSLADGAIGIPPGVTGDKLVIIDDETDLQSFAQAVTSLKDNSSHIPSAYFDFFNAAKIGRQAAEFIAAKFA